MAAIKRVAQRRVVSIELTEDSLEQEALWRSRRLQLQQARLHSKGTAADQKSSSPGGWLGSASLSARANGEHGSGLLIHSDSQSAAPSDADEREMYQQVAPRHTERPLHHELLMHGHDDSSRRPDTEAYSETQRETQTHETQPDTETHRETQGDTPTHGERESIQRDSDDDSDDFGSGDGLHAEPETTPSYHAEPETAPSLKLSASLPRDMRCPKGHELLAFETPIDGYKCDECGAIVGAGHLMHSCRPCEHDVCEDCDSSRRLDTETHSDTQGDTPTHGEIQRDSDDDSDDFGSGDGLHAEPETTPSLKLSASLPRDMQCPKGHELLAFETPIDGYKCDECGAIVGAGHLMHSCRPCEHDVCEDCVRSRIPFQRFSLPEKPAHPSMLDEVGVTTAGAFPAQ